MTRSRSPLRQAEHDLYLASRTAGTTVPSSPAG